LGVDRAAGNPIKVGNIELSEAEALVDGLSHRTGVGRRGQAASEWSIRLSGAAYPVDDFTRLNVKDGKDMHPTR
jgi:hypothetical protein